MEVQLTKKNFGCLIQPKENFSKSIFIYLENSIEIQEV